MPQTGEFTISHQHNQREFQEHPIEDHGMETRTVAGAPDGTGKGSITQVFSRGKTGLGGEPTTWAAFAVPSTL